MVTAGKWAAMLARFRRQQLCVRTDLSVDYLLEITLDYAKTPATQIEGLASSKTLASKLGEREGYGGPCDVTSLSL